MGRASAPDCSPGRLFGQPRLADGRLMDDVIGYAPVLVADAALLQGATIPEGVAVVSTDDSPDVAAQLARFGTRAVLLRPDCHILGAVEDRDDLTELCSTAFFFYNPAHLETL